VIVVRGLDHGVEKTGTVHEGNIAAVLGRFEGAPISFAEVQHLRDVVLSAVVLQESQKRAFFGSLSWTAASGRGTIVAFNITKTALRSAFKDDVPYVYALIRLDEGPIISSNIINCDPSSVYIEMPVKVVFWNIDDLGVTIPYFEPDGAAAQNAQSNHE
jgi:uncharacterized OB-fold protein